MKNNIFGYLFFIFIIGIMAFAIYKVNYSETEQEVNNVVEGTSTTLITKKGTKLTLGISEFDTINPIITKNKQVQNISSLLFESLVNISSDGKVYANLAKEWETTDNLTYIIRLQGGIKWSDGTYFSSSDVQYTINRLKEADKSSVYKDNVKNVREVDIIDNTTLRVILSKAVPFYEYYLNFPILSSKYYGDEDFWNTEKNKDPITTGRFEISDVTTNTITLQKNKNWWNIEEEDSIIETININLYSSLAELYNAFKLGSLDIIATTNKNYQDYIGKIGYNVTETEGRNFVFLALNTKSKLLSDVNIRRVIKNAINNDEIVSKIYDNSYSVANFPVSAKNYLVNYTNKNNLNIGEIESKLKENGWLMVKGQWRKIIDYKATYLELNLVVKKDSKRKDVANYIREFFGNQGIMINVIQVSNDEYKKYLENKNYDLILCEATESITPDLTSYFGENNLANFENGETKEIMKYIDNITDENELKSKFQKLYDINDNEVPYIGIARNKMYIITNSYLSAKIDARWYNIFYNFKDWYTS